MNWTKINSDFPELTILDLEISGTTLFAGTDSGPLSRNVSGVYRSVDNGTTWTQNNVGLGNLFNGPFALNGGTLFIGASNNGVYSTADSGVTWTKSGLGTLSAISLGVNGATVFAGTSSRGPWRSSDNGLKWTTVNTGITNHSISSWLVSGTTLFAGGFIGVYRSVDNGTSWTPVNNGFPSIINVKSLAVVGTVLG